jgi:hypothetical protein
MSFGLQTALLWTVFLQRHTLVGKLTTAVSGQQPGREAQLKRLLGIGYVARTVLPARRRPTPTPAGARYTSEPADAAQDTAPALPEPASFRQGAEATPVRPRSLTGTRRHPDQTLPDAVTPERAAVGADAELLGGTGGHRRARAQRAQTGAETDTTPAPVAPLARRPQRSGAADGAPPARRRDRASARADEAPVRPPTADDAAVPRSPQPASAGAGDLPAAPPPPRQEDIAAEPSLADQLRGDRQRLDPEAPNRAAEPAAAARRPPPTPPHDESGAPPVSS